MIKIGHRGAKGYVAENTLASFQKAIDLNVHGIELDVHASKDRIPVVIHDETVNRTTNKKGFIDDFNSAELQKLGIPTLEDVFNLVNQKCFINIEIKDKNATKAVLDLVEKFTVTNNWDNDLFLISSFYWTILEDCKSINKKILLGVLTENTSEEALTFAKKIKAFSIHPHFKLLTEENVTLMHQNGFKVFPWTINELADINIVKNLKVDGIISDFPDRI